MPYSGLLPWIFTSIAASVAGVVSGVHAGLPLLSWAAVLLFAVSLIAASFETNRPWWDAAAKPCDPTTAASAAEINTRLLIAAYAWGGLAMLGVYRLSGLSWRHGWQYAAGMGLIALLLTGYVRMLGPGDSPLRRESALALAARMSALQAAVALAGLAFLLLSGKLGSSRPDWAANQIFLGGGIAVTILSAIATYSHYRLIRANRESRGLAQVGG